MYVLVPVLVLVYTVEGLVDLFTPTTKTIRTYYKYYTRITTFLPNITTINRFLPSSTQSFFETKAKPRRLQQRALRSSNSYSRRIYVRTKHGARIMTKTSRYRMLTCSAFSSSKIQHLKDHNYDTDSFLIGVDGHSSYCMTNNDGDFIDKPRRVKVRIKGISGSLHSALCGT